MDHQIPLNAFSGSLSKPRKRVGRGIGSRGRTCGAGNKGQCARSGTSMKLRHREFARRLPKVGFRSHKEKMRTVNLSRIVQICESKDIKEVSVSTLKDFGFTSKLGIKVIGKCDVNRPISIEAHYFTEGAKESITKAGGKAVCISASA